MSVRQRLVRFYRSDAVLPFRWKRRVKELVYNRFGALLAGSASYQLYRQHLGRPHRRALSPQQRDAWLLSQHRALFCSEAEQEWQRFLAADQKLLFGGSSDASPCTAVVVLHNKVHLTYRCLRALSQQLAVRLSLVVVDNASTDGTAALLDRLAGSVQVIRNSDNRHFLHACNQAFALLDPGAGAVALVNNDAQLEPLALAEALSTLQRFPSAGAVSGMVLHPDGRLQEAGSVLFADGSCLGVGRRAEAFEPLWNVRRPVDYGSGCLLVVRADLLQQLGGFDSAYAPAYYEETDLCLRLQSSGKSVLYEPACRARHVEFGSSDGRFEAVRPLMEAHRLLLVERHRQRLMGQPNAVGFDATDPRQLLNHLPRGPRLLWIDDNRPSATAGAGFARLDAVIKALADMGCWVTVFATDGLMGPADQRASSDYELLCGSRDDLQFLLERRQGFYSHLCASRQHNIQMLRDLLPLLPQPQPVLLADVESLFSVREWSRSCFERNGVPLQQVEPALVSGLPEELASLSGFDRLLAVSAAERELMAAGTGKPCWTVGHGLALVDPPASYTSSEGVLFLGAIRGCGSPNFDSLQWLLEEILPCLVQLSGGDSLPITVAGHHDPQLVGPLYAALQERFPQVQCLGFCADLDGLMQRHRVFLAPTRFAAGLPHKVHQAAAHGLPVVTTPLIASQMSWEPGRDLLVGQTASALAEALLKLHGDRQLWQTIADAARVRVAQECDPVLLQQTLQQAFAMAVVDG
jgi:GT2 family glycosyltransferase